MEVIICVGGEDDKVVLRSVEMFDPDTCRWKPLSCLPFAISKHGMVSSGKCASLTTCWRNLDFDMCISLFHFS